MSEEWRPVEGFEGYYEVSDQGRVRSLDRKLNTKRGDKFFRGRVLKQANARYRTVVLARLGELTPREVHRLVALAFIPNPNGMPNVLHWDDDPSNNRVENLRWGTDSDNQRDIVRNGNHWQANKTHCPQGHPLSGDNLIYDASSGARRCGTCRRSQARRRRNGAAS